MGTTTATTTNRIVRRKLFIKLLIGVFVVLSSVGAQAQVNYFSKGAATDFTDVNSWGTAADGTGASPASITNADNYTIQNGSVMNLNTANAAVRQLTINAGSLTIGSNTLTVSITAQCNTTFTIGSGGTLTVSGTGTLNINGRFILSANGIFNQSGGNINVDGNNGGVAATSVASGLAIVSLSPSLLTSINLTGGTFTIVDPHANSTASETLNLSGSTNGPVNVTTGHTIRFGNGTSTDAGGNSTNGFRINTWATTTGMPFGNMIVEGPTGTNRFVSGAFQQPILGNLTVNNGGECRIATVILRGDLTVNSGGTFTSITSLALATGTFLNGSSITISAAPNAQTIGGPGTFRNLTASPTGNFTALVFNNSSSTGITFSNALNNLSGAAGFSGASVTGAITFTTGKISTPAASALLWGTGAARGTGTFTYTAGGMTSGSTFAIGTTAGQTGTTITSGSVPIAFSATSGGFPFLDPSGNVRHVWIERNTASAAGIIAVKYTDAAGTSPVAIVDASPAYTVDKQFNGKWTVSAFGTTPNATSFELAISAVNAFGAAMTANYPRITTLTSTVGTNQAGTTLPHGQRSGLTLAQLTAQDFYIGANSADIPSCGAPITLGVTDITSSTADISWVAPGTGTPATYDWEIRTSGAGGSGGAGLTTSGFTTAPTVSVNDVPGLTAATAYNLYVRTNCSGGGGSSTWTGPFSFNTTLDCSLATSLTCGSSATSGNLGVAGGIYNPPATSCGFTTPGKEKLYSFTSTVAGTYTLNVTGINGGTGFIDYFFKPAAGGCGPTGWTCIKDLSGVATWTFTLAASTTYFILLDAESASTTSNHTFQIDCPVACTAPTAVTAGSITSTTASISWTCASCTGTFELDWGPTGHAAGTGTIITGVSSPYTLNPPLTASTGYTVYVRQNCSGGGNGFSAWSAAANFTTLGTPPANDDCSGAISLPIPTTCTPVAGTSLNGTQSLSSILCDGFNGTSNDDVWYSFVANNTIATIVVDGDGTFDAVVDLRSGACNGTNIACADLTSGGAVETINATGLTIGNTYYIRVYDYGTGTGGTFTICVSTPAPVFTFTGPGNYTDPTKWSPAYPGTSIPSGSTVVIGSGTCTLTTAVNNAGTITVASGATLINNNTLTSTGTFNNNGTYKGEGIFAGSVFTNSGFVAPGQSPGCTVFGAGYNNGGGTETIEIGGTTVCTQYDRLQVTGTATLSGTLDVQLFGGFNPSCGQSFTIMTSTAISGTFATVNTPALPGGLVWDLQYNSPNTGDVTLSIVPTTGPVQNTNTGLFYCNIQAAINAGTTLNGHVIVVQAGTYNEEVNINKELTIRGNNAGIAGNGGGRGAESILTGNAGAHSGFVIAANNVTIDGFTVREGAGTFESGIYSGTATSGARIINNIFTDNNKGIYPLGTGHIIRDNLFDANNRPLPAASAGVSIYTYSSTGLVIDSNEFRNNSLNAEILFDSYAPGAHTNATITRNYIHGNTNAGSAVYLAGINGALVKENQITHAAGPRAVKVAGGNNNIVISYNNLSTNTRGIQVANDGFGINTNIQAHYNNLAANTSAGVANDDAGSTNVNVTCNWYGTVLGPAIATNLGGSGSAVTGVGPKIYANWLNYGTDASPNIGVQLPTAISVTAGSNTTMANNHYRLLSNAVGCLVDNQTLTVIGTFNFGNPTAMNEWAKGNDQMAGAPNDLDDYSILVPSPVVNATVTATALGSGVIQGPGDLSNVSFEGPFFFNNNLPTSSNQGWTLSNLVIKDFDLSIGAFMDGTGNATAFNDFKIINNQIDIPVDLNGTTGGETGNAQNIGIHYSFGTNQLISGNSFNIDGTGTSDGVNRSTTIVMQSNTSGGTLYDGLRITNNTFSVTGDPDPSGEAVIRGIWENGHNTNADIEISGNIFSNASPTNLANTNRQFGMWQTSHSGLTKNVVYKNNEFSGWNTGISSLGGPFTANTPPNYDTGELPVLVENNKFDKMQFAVVARKGAASTNAGSPLTVGSNSFTNITAGGFAIVNEGPTGTTPSICNWYGTVSFPAIAAMNSGSVYVSSILNSGADGAGVGFQPLGTCIVPPVHNVTQDIYYFTIQSAIDAPTTVNGDSITVSSGMYNEQVTVYKQVSLRGIGATKPVVNYSGTPANAGRPALFDVTQPNVSIRNFELNVNMTNLGSAVIASAAAVNNLVVDSNNINPYRTAAYGPAFGLRNAVSVNYGTLRVSGSSSGNITGTRNVITYFDNGTPGDPTDDAGFRSGFALDESSGFFDNNTIRSVSQDIQLRFADPNNTIISNNNINGGGVELAEHNGGGGTFTVSNNIFNGIVGSTYTSALRLKNNYTARTTTVSGNTFTGHNWGLSLENYQAVTVDNNAFTPAPASTTYRHITVNTKEGSSSSGFFQPMVSGTFTNNTFNGSGAAGGRGISFYNEDNDSPVFGAITIGTAGNENDFNAGVGTFIYLDNTTGTTNPNATPTVPFAVNLDASNNNFDAGAGLQLPAAMTQASLFALEDKIQHKIDALTLGFVLVKANNDYVTVNSFVAPNVTAAIQRGIDAASGGFTVNVGPGIFIEDVIANKQVTLLGSGLANTTISGAIGGADGATVRIAAAGVIVDGFKITREGNNTTDWNNPNLNSAGVAVQGLTVWAEIRNNLITGNRTGIDVNNSNGNNIHNNVIDFNRTGLIFRNQTDNTNFQENFVRDNWTAGIVFLDASGGTNVPVQSAANSFFNNNHINGNWYGEVVDRQAGGSLPAPGTNIKNFECNWWGATSAPVVTIANSAEPGYAAQIPVAYGGSATNPGTALDIYGPASANIDHNPWLTNGTDNDLIAVGFQPVPGFCTGTPVIIVSAVPDHIICGETSGSILVTFNGGTAPYDITWTGGSATNISSPYNITPLPAGVYSITITDANGTTATTSATVQYLPVTNTTNNTYFPTIQAAINAGTTANGHTLSVCAGTYAENVVVNKSLTIEGPNAAIDACSGIRVAEAIVVPATSDIANNVIFTVTVSNVSISGFTIDGDNTLLTSGFLGTNGADLDAAEGIGRYVNNVNNLSVTNNIIRNLSYFGVDNDAPGGTPSTGNVVSNNKFTDLGTYDPLSGINLWGGAVLVYNNQYTAVTNNCMTNVRIGVQTGNFYAANPGAATYQAISGNTISARRRGIFHNLSYTAASPYTVSGNTITGVAHVSETAAWDAILVSSMGTGIASTVSNNIINGSAITALPTVGISVWNDQQAPLISGGTITGVGLGINVNNFEGYPSAGSNANNTSATIDGVTVTGATIAGIRVNDNPSNTNGATVSAEIRGNTNVSGSPVGILVTGSDASSNIHDNSLTITGNVIGIDVNGGTVSPLYRNTISANGTGVRVINSGILGLTSENFITNNTVDGIRIEASAGTIAGINNNDLSGNTGFAVNNANAVLVDATCNWYGSADGNIVFAEINGNVDYIPYLTNGTDNAPGTAGFQPVPGSCGGPGNFYVNDLNTGDDYYTTAPGNDANAGTASAPFLTIQKALAVAAPGNTIYVDGGTYITQVDINKTISIIGAGRSGAFTTRIKAPAVPASVTNANGSFQPIIYAHEAGNTINLDSLLIDGDGGRTIPNYLGVYYFEASGSLTKSRVQAIRDATFSGSQSGSGVFVNHTWDTPLSHSVTIDDNEVVDYQKTGILVNEINTQAIITNNTVTGQAITGLNAQNGIQLGYGAYGTITGNTITANLYNSANPHLYLASGIILVGTGVDLTNTPTGNTTTIGSNNLNGNEAGMLADGGGFGYNSVAGIIYNGDTYANNKVHVQLNSPAAVPTGSNSYDKRVDNPVQTNTVFGSIQYGVDFASAGNTLNVSTGTFMENVLVHTPVLINGNGQANTIVMPAISAPDICGGSSLCPGSSNVFLVQAQNVTIQNLTVNGDNPSLPGGINVGGANVDARIGIVTDHLYIPFTQFNNLNVNNVTVKNTFYRGIYTSTDNTFSINNNTVMNVQGDPGSVAILNFGGSGTINGNTITASADGISSNYSTGTTYSGNNLTGAGIHTDNNGGGAPAVADVIRNNTITNAVYGVMAFIPYVAVEISENTITNTDTAIVIAGQGSPVTVQVLRNEIDGLSVANSVGVYQTTNLFGFGSSDVAANYQNNYVTNNSTGFVLETETGYSSNTVANNNSITNATFSNGVDTTGTGTATRNFTCNWWGVPGGNALVTAVGEATNYAPWLKSGADASGAIGFQPAGVCGYDDNLYVNDNDGGNGYTTAPGNDANPGVPAAPFRTINKAISVAQPTGNTVWVDAGTYAENVVANKSISFKGRQAGNTNLTTRNAAFVVGKANPTIESVLTTPVSNPLNNPNDIVKLLSNAITFDGFVLDGNNDTIPGPSTVTGGGVDIDARRGFTNVNAVGAGSVIDINNLTLKNNFIQNVAQRGVSFASNGAVLTGNLIDSNLVRGFGYDPVNGGQGVILFTNAYANITNNVIDVPNDQIGLHLQNFYSNGTMTWSNNNVTVGQDAFGIHANLFYAPGGVLNINNNTVNARTGVTGTSGFTWGINIWSVQAGADVNLNGNTIGNLGGSGTFGRGINLWNLPTSNTVTITGGTVANSVIGINLDNIDPYFGAGSTTFVNVNGTVVSNSQTGIRARTASLLVAPFSGSNTTAGSSTIVLGSSTTVNASGTNTGIEVNAPASSAPNMARVYFDGASVVTGGSNTPVSVNGDQAEFYAATGTITAPVAGSNNAIQFSNITATNTTSNLVIMGGTTVNMNGNTAARAFASPQYSIVEIAGSWTAPSRIAGGLHPLLINGKMNFNSGILSTAAVADTIEFGGTANDIMTGSTPEKATSYILGRAKMLSRTVNNGAIDMLGVNLGAQAGAGADLGNLILTRTTTSAGSITPAFPLNQSIRTVWNIIPSNTSSSRASVRFRYLNIGTNINGQNPASIYAYRFTAGSWQKISASLSSGITGDIYTTDPFGAPSFSPWTLSSQATAYLADFTPIISVDNLGFPTPGSQKDILVNIIEVGGAASNSPVIFRLNKSNSFTLLPTCTSSCVSNVGGGTANNNSDWTYVDSNPGNPNSGFWVVTLKPASTIPANGTSRVGFTITRNLTTVANTTYNCTATIQNGTGGDSNNNNNTNIKTLTAQ